MPKPEMSWTDRFSIRFDEPEDEEEFSIVLIDNLHDAYLGIVECADGPPRACYSYNTSVEIMKREFGLEEKYFPNFVDQILGGVTSAATPAFLRIDV